MNEKSREKREFCERKIALKHKFYRNFDEKSREKRKF